MNPIDDNVKKELKMLFIMFGIAFIIYSGFVFFRHWENRLRISPLNHSTFRAPSTPNIQNITIIEKNSCTAGNTSQNHQFEVEILKWMQDAEPLSVRLPKLYGNLKTSGCGVPYTQVYLSTETGDALRIFPAFYISNNVFLGIGGSNYVTKYVNNVIEIVDRTNHEYFFKSKGFYDWLINN